MIIYADAATRIDLAGGTLDIYPLYLFEEFGITVNAAIDLKSQARVATRHDRKVVLYSEDLDLIEEAKSLEELRPSGAMDLVARVLKFYSPGQGLEVTTCNHVPKGSGLGASSSLLISLSAALIHLTGKTVDPEKVIEQAANIETQSIRIPTGKQDYYPPIYGGFHALRFEAAGVRRERLKLSKKFQTALQQRLVLSFTGESRFSGTSNWNMLKRYVDQIGDTAARIKQIKQTAIQLREALLQERLEDVGRLVGEEWINRKQLAEEVTNARIDSIMNAGRRAGAISSKICGAGGGGCMITFVKPGRRAAVTQALTEAGARVLDYRFRQSGVRVRIERRGEATCHLNPKFLPP
ncbi:MAG: hypothetical protein HY644_10470 [Acidobacteria bacterium]|nr:hypothetical protein [Acidobacteriota bacterium]